MLTKFFNTLFGNRHAAFCFKEERFGNHGNGQYAHLFGRLCNDRRSTRSGSATHASRDKYHVCTGNHLHDPVTVFQRGLSAHFRVCTCTQTFCHARSDL